MNPTIQEWLDAGNPIDGLVGRRIEHEDAGTRMITGVLDKRYVVSAKDWGKDYPSRDRWRVILHEGEDWQGASGTNASGINVENGYVLMTVSTVLETPTARLQYRALDNGKLILQQQWHIEETTDAGTTVHVEWRDVPVGVGG